MESRNISTIMAAITETTNKHEVTTRTENDADFGCPAPSSLLTLTLFKIKYMLIAYLHVNNSAPIYACKIAIPLHVVH
jgi:hypothetical protein